MLTAIKKEDVPNATRGKHGAYARKTLVDFCNSGAEAAIVSFPEKNVKTVYASLKKAQEREYFPVVIMKRKDKVYLIRKEEE